MAYTTIEVERREERGDGACGRLRRDGWIPAVVYGGERETLAVRIAKKLLLDSFKEGGTENRIYLLQLAGTDKSRHAMVKEIQIDAASRQLLHIDFQRILMDRKIRVKVHVRPVGVAVGVKNQGGVLDLVRRELELECLPGNIPAEIQVDVSALTPESTSKRARSRCPPTSPCTTIRTRRSSASSTPGSRWRRSRPRLPWCRPRRRSRRSSSAASPRRSPRLLRLVVGLGNPGPEYRATRHNLGFLVVEEVARRRRCDWSYALCGARLAVAPDVWLVEPQTFMNRSGLAVRCLAERAPAERHELLIVFDDVALPLGRLRLRARGSAGGHRGLASILENLQSSEIARLRLGIGRGETAPAEEADLVAFVLAPFESAERPEVEAMVGRAADAVAAWLTESLDEVAARFNAAPAP